MIDKRSLYDAQQNLEEKDHLIKYKAQIFQFQCQVCALWMWNVENNNELRNETPDFNQWKIFRKSWINRERKEVVWIRTGQIPVENEVGRRRWRCIAHKVRRNNINVARQVLRCNPQLQRRSCELEMKTNGHSWSDLIQMTRERDGWKMFVRCLYPDRGERQRWRWTYLVSIPKVTINYYVGT